MAACFACGAPLVSPKTVTRGTLIASRYEVLSQLGRGGMGVVYKAHDRILDETVALKLLRPDVASQPEMARRFRSEIRLARKVRHENVCGIHEYGEEGGLRYIAMEFVDGVDVRRLVRDGGLPRPEAFEVAIQAARGLDAIHEAGIIHRDLKTANIMCDSHGLVRLMDFGIAKEFGADVTIGGRVAGTPEYMSPEQARGRAVDFRSDIYALGVVVYEVFTGRVPFKSESPIGTIMKHLHDPPPLDGLPPELLPPALLPVLRRALAKEPADRFATARELAEALEQARADAGFGIPGGPTPVSVASGRMESLVDKATLEPATALRGPIAILPGTDGAVETTTRTALASSRQPRAVEESAPVPIPAPARPARKPRGPHAALGVAGAMLIGVLLFHLVRTGPGPRPLGTLPSAAPTTLSAPSVPSPELQAPSDMASAPPSIPVSRGAERPTAPRRERGGAPPTTTPSQPPVGATSVPAAAERSPAPEAAVNPVPAEVGASATEPIAAPPSAIRPDPANRPPEYPESLRAQGKEGQVFLKIVVSTGGEVEDVQVLAGETAFAEAAVTAARGWRYGPVIVAGQPRAAYFVVRVPFRARKR